MNPILDDLNKKYVARTPHMRDIGMRITGVDRARGTMVLPARPDWLGDPARGLPHAAASAGIFVTGARSFTVADNHVEGTLADGIRRGALSPRTRRRTLLTHDRRAAIRVGPGSSMTATPTPRPVRGW